MAKVTLQTLGRRLRESRGSRGIRELARELGISAATLSRVERGHPPDLETFRRICQWLAIDPGEVLGISPRTTKEVGGRTVSVHFKKDETLKPATAKALAEMILAAQRAWLVARRTQMPFEKGFKKWCETIGAQLRVVLGLSETSPVNPWGLAEYLGLVVRTPYDVPGLRQSHLETLVKGDPGSWSAVTLSGADQDVVILNPAHSRARQEKDLMHELAHVILGHEPSQLHVAEGGSPLIRGHDNAQEAEADWLADSLTLVRSR